MEAVIAGWALGHAMGIICTVALTWVAVSAGDVRAVSKFLPEGLPPILAAVPISMAMALAWTMIGLIVGSGFALYGPKEPSGLFPSVPYFIAVAAIGVMPVAFFVLISPRRWWLWVIVAASFVGLFGLALPVLATR